MNHGKNMLEISYTYRRHDYSDGTSLRNTYLSRHHIIPYYKMYGFGVIVLTYLYLKLKENDNYTVESGIHKLVNKYGNHYFNEHNIKNALKDREEIDESSCQICLKDKSGGNLDNFLKYISWTNQNLFIGPSENLRADDPGQNCESCPESLEKNEFVSNLMRNRLKGRGGSIPNVKEESGTLQLSYHELENISNTFLKNLNKRNSIHETLLKDWKAVYKNNIYDIYFVKKVPRSEDIKELVPFKFHLKSNRQTYNTSKKAIAIYKFGKDWGLGWVKNIESEAKNQQIDSILKYKQYFEINL